MPDGASARAADEEEPAPVVDVLRYETRDGTDYRLTEAGNGRVVVDAHVREFQKRRLYRRALAVTVTLGAAGVGGMSGLWWAGAAAGAVTLAAFAGFLRRNPLDEERYVPELVEEGATRYRAERRYDVNNDE